MVPDMTVSTEVADALRSNTPVVALESTLITHGLPWPSNAETALAMEHAVRKTGAVPATIAVLGGTVTVGVSPADIERLASRSSGSVRKCSRRDLPIVVARHEDASTTVAGTMIVAHQAGIRVFGTGGIGGVHRGAPFDVSADLVELGRTPIAVVCAGAKSILDLPATLEVLETQGVPVVGLGTETLPGFYARSSGLPIDVRVETPEEAAAIVDAARRHAGSARSTRCSLWSQCRKRPPSLPQMQRPRFSEPRVRPMDEAFMARPSRRSCSSVSPS
jgi:pseudouridine-5'-phosphate glycosidase